MIQTPLTTCNVLDLLKEKFEATSDYQLAKKIGWSTSLISQYRCKPQFMADHYAIKAAKMLDYPAGFIVCCIHAERAKEEEEKIVWLEMADQILKATTSKGGKKK